MANTYFTIVTNSGTKKMLEAVNEEKKVNVTDFAVGDGGGMTYTPTPDMTALKNEVWRGKINACYINKESENLLIIENVLPSNVGGFTIREMGIFDADGTLIAICNTPDTQKVKVSDGVLHELELSMEILLSNADSVELVVDPTVIMATKKDIENLNVRCESESVAVGSGSVANGANTSAYGLNSTADGAYSTTIGALAQAEGIGSTAIGGEAIAKATDSAAIGAFAQANEACSMAIGRSSKANGNFALAIGYFANCDKNNTLAIGDHASVNALDGVAIGRASITNSSYSIAIGRSANASGLNLIAVGSYTSTNAKNSILIGCSYASVADNSEYSVAIGANVSVSGNASDSVAIGVNAHTSYNESVAIGSRTVAMERMGTAVGSAARACAVNATAIGYKAATSYDANHSTAIGYNASTSNKNSMQLGDSSELSSITARVGITVTSDERDKADIVDLEDRAVEFLRKIRTIRYVYNNREMYIPETLSDEEKEKRDRFGLCEYDREAHAAGTKKGQRIRVGVSAQGTQEALKEVYDDLGYADLVNDNLFDYSPDEIPEGVENQLGVNYEKFIPFLIKGFQELDKRLTGVEERMGIE